MVERPVNRGNLVQPLSMRGWTGVVAAMTLALGLRFYHLGEPNFWLDELHSMVNSAGYRAELEALPHGVLLERVPRFTDMAAERSFVQTWRTMRHDGHPPLYFLLLYAWRRTWGDGECAVRTLSAILSTLSILPVVLMLRDMGRARLAPWAALVLAVCFAHLRMAQENRPYALSILLVTTAFWLLVRMERRASTHQLKRFPLSCTDSGKVCDVLASPEPNAAHKGRRYIKAGAVLGKAQVETRGNARPGLCVAYGLTLFLALMNHYFSALPLIAHAAYAALRFRGRVLTSWCLGVTVSAAAWWLVWGNSFLAQLDFIAAQEWLREERADHGSRSLMRFFDVPLRLLFDHPAFDPTIGKALIGAVILSLVAVWAIRRRRPDALLPLLWVACPMLVFLSIDVCSGRQMLSHSRYTSVGAPGLVILIVLVVGGWPRIWRAALVGTYLGTAALTLSLPTPQNPHSRTAALMLTEHVRPGEPVIYEAIDWPRFWASSMYLTVNYYLPQPLEPVVLLRTNPDVPLLERLRPFNRIHVVSPRVKVDPNPFPDYYRRSFKSDYLEQIGWIYTFEEEGSLEATPS